LAPVELTADEEHTFYGGFANSTLWPLYHDAIVVPQFEQSWWRSYVEVNRRFAEAAASVAEPGSLVWVHDYHLQLVPRMVRELRDDVAIGFFLHIPFPAQELFLRLPWREEVTAGLLGADVVGFQTEIGAQNFRHVAGRLLGHRVQGKGVVSSEKRRTVVDTFPIGIDAERFRRAASSAPTRIRARQIRHELRDPRTVLLGVDRLDYTKGIPVRLRAYRELLAERRIDPVQCVLVQIGQPTRDDVAGYAEVRTEVDRIVGGINGDFGQLGRVAVKYLHKSQDFDELVALYRAADVMLVTPLRDGMNLVAKEYVASRVDGTGTLILSEFAGAANELSQASLVNPFDVEGIKDAIEHAVAQDPAATRGAMAALRGVVTRNDATHWANSFLGAMGRPHRASAA
jgi:trehalose 6-phosphate synthase